MISLGNFYLLMTSNQLQTLPFRFRPHHKVHLTKKTDKATALDIECT